MASATSGHDFFPRRLTPDKGEVIRNSSLPLNLDSQPVIITYKCQAGAWRQNYITSHHNVS